MADVLASEAVKLIRDLWRHEKKINEVMDLGKLLVSSLKRTRSLLNKSSQIEDHERRFRDIEHEIEDILETFVLDATVMLQKNKGRFIKRFFRTFFRALGDGYVLENIKQGIILNTVRIEFLNHMFTTGNIHNIHNEPSVVSQGQGWLWQTYPRGIEEYFVGMDDELDKLVSLIVNKQTPVIFICGVAGSGKTTITGKIFKQQQVRKRFEAFAWICLSQVSQISDILLNILRQLSPRRVIETFDMKTLKDKLKDVQRKCDCLIVLDNVQDMDQWRQLAPALKTEGVRRSVILLTTREENIGKEGLPHKLRLLNDGEAWDLLKKHAFPRKDGRGGLILVPPVRTVSSKGTFSKGTITIFSEHVTLFINAEHVTLPTF